MRSRSVEQLVAKRRWPGWFGGRRIRMLRRMDPSVGYYLVVGGIATLLGVVADVATDVPWWSLTTLGIAGGWAFTWLTALDDVRHPWRSSRILAAEFREASSSDRVRAAANGLPLFVPAMDLPGHRWFSGGGWRSGNSLLSPILPFASTSWSHSTSTLSVTTVTEPDEQGSERVIPRGIGGQLAPFEDELAGVTVDDLLGRIEPVTVEVNGRPVTGTMLDLRQWGLGWLAELRLDDRYRLDLASTGLTPADVKLERRAIEDLPDAPG